MNHAKYSQRDRFSSFLFVGISLVCLLSFNFGCSDSSSSNPMMSTGGMNGGEFMSMGGQEGGNEGDGMGGNMGGQDETGGMSGGEDGGNQSVAVTYHQDIRPLLETHCTHCHRPEGVGLFDLTSYEAASQWAPAMIEATQSKRMPPWGAFESEDCTPRFGWADDQRLTQTELDLLVQWQEQGKPEGDEDQAIAGTPFETIQLGRIDFEGSAQIPIQVEAGSDDFICVVIDPQITEETWIKGIEFVPDNEALVHHVVLFTDPTRASLEKAGDDGTYSCFGSAGVPGSVAAAWAPGIQPARYPDDHAMRVQPGTLFVMQMHYSPQGGADELSDQTHLRFEYADEAPQYEIYLQLMGNFDFKMHPGMGLTTDEFSIPANAEYHHEQIRWTYTGQLFGGADAFGPANRQELRLLSASPHMHYAGVDMKVKIDRVLEGEQACGSGHLTGLLTCGSQKGCLEDNNLFGCLNTECPEQWDVLATQCWGCAHKAFIKAQQGLSQDQVFAELLKCEQPKPASNSSLITSEQPANECLASVPAYNFEWQRAYAYDAPLEELPVFSPGDVMTIDCYYNNSMNNRLMREALGRAGISEPEEVHLGDETLDEMCLVGLLFAFERRDVPMMDMMTEMPNEEMMPPSP